MPRTLKELADLYWENAKELQDKLEKKMREGRKITYIEFEQFKDACILLTQYPTPYDLYKKLKEIASQFSGCVRCKHSIPCPQYPADLYCRYCELKLSQGTCNKFEEFEDL